MSVVGIYVRVFFLAGLAAVAWISVKEAEKMRNARAAEQSVADKRAAEELQSIPNLYNTPPPPAPENAAPPSGEIEIEPQPSGMADPNAMRGLAPSQPNTRHFLLTGRVYDLVTLRPVPNAVLSFETNGNSSTVSSGPDGSYKVKLRSTDDGYEIRAKSPAYAVPTLHEPDVPYRALSNAERRRLAEVARANDLASTRLGDDGGETVRRDLFLAPARN